MDKHVHKNVNLLVCMLLNVNFRMIMATPLPLHHLHNTHTQVPQVVVRSDVKAHSTNIVIRSDVINPKPVVIPDCPEQHFQVPHLLLYLDSALGPDSDVLLEPYLLCWEELIK